MKVIKKENTYRKPRWFEDEDTVLSGTVFAAIIICILICL